MPASSSPDKPATIYEIAKQAGVSSSTVARVLRGDVKETWPSTARRAARIRRLAEELGYRANWRAKAFSEKRTWTVALFYTNTLKILDGIHAEIVEGLNDMLQSRGYSLMLMPVESENFERTVQGSRLDGYATMAETLPAAASKLLRASGLPEVALNNAPNDGASGVVVDDFRGGYSAARHMLELGHRKVGFYLDSEARAHYSIDERLKGIKSCMREFGLDGGPEVFHVDHNEIKAVLADPARRPTAMICYSHLEAKPILSFMYQLGLRVPDTLSVIGFNDDQSDVTSPPLTTVSYNGHRMGKVAAQLLLRLIDRDQSADPHSVTLKHHLTVRGSTASIKS
ncbi:MAG: LacI family DNA-binding transcriptional regulator [Planctomycetota bacterium]